MAARRKLAVPQSDIDRVESALRLVLEVREDLDLLTECGQNCQDMKDRLDRAQRQLEAFKANTAPANSAF